MAEAERTVDEVGGKVAIVTGTASGIGIGRAIAKAIQHGVPVNAVGSGDVVTNLLETFRGDGREFLTERGKAAPIGRAAEPREVAEVVAFLASERASFIVGSIVMADGGYSVPIK